MIHRIPLLQRSLQRLRRTFGRGGPGATRPGPCTVAVVLPLEGQAGSWMLQQQIDLLRRLGHNPGLAGAPHVTLKMGFKTQELDPLRTWLDELGASTAAQQVRLQGIDCFPQGVLFLNVVETAALEALRQQVLQELAGRFGVQPGAVEDHRFRFHATLTCDLPAALLQQEQQRLEALAAGFIEPVAALELWLDAGSHWVRLHRTLLRGCARDELCP